MNKDPIVIFQKQHINRIAFLFGLLAIAVVMLIAGIMILRNKAVQIKAERTERVQLMADLNAIAELSDGKKSADALLPALQDALPQNIDVPIIVIPKIKALGAARGIKTEFTLTGGTPTAQAGFSGLNFVLRAEGSLASTINFIADVEGAKNVISISDWSITRGSGGVAELTVNGLVYTRNTP